MKKGLIITGGRMNLEFAAEFVKNHPVDCVVAVDGGVEQLKKLKLRPTAIVGDFDTVDPKILETYKQDDDILWDVHKPEKDETDTELAINTAMKLGCETLYILGATGGRLDHEWSNLHLLKLCLDHQVDACLVDAGNQVSLLNRGKTFYKDAAFGTYVSFLPLTEHVDGITLTGFKYPLKDKNITIGAEAGLCISNEIVEQEATIQFRKGILICVESRDQ